MGNNETSVVLLCNLCQGEYDSREHFLGHMEKECAERLKNKFGPWLGVSQENQEVCAVVGCEKRGRPQVCLYDGRAHHHGCIHYDVAKTNGDASRAGIEEFRKDWCLLCDDHYSALEKSQSKRRFESRGD